MRRLIVAGAIALLILVCLLVRVRAENQDACADQLQRDWNQFATDANRHIQTVEVSREKHEQQHKRLENAWRGLQRLACW